jgi:hypothetical protein
VLKPYLSDPLTVRPSKSRFCDGRTYAVLYAAGDFAKAFAEVVVRDRRLVPFRDIAARGWVEFASTGDLRIFDRALENLTPTITGDLERLPAVLRMHRVRIER